MIFYKPLNLSEPVACSSCHKVLMGPCKFPSGMEVIVRENFVIIDSGQPFCRTCYQEVNGSKKSIDPEKWILYAVCPLCKKNIPIAAAATNDPVVCSCGKVFFHKLSLNRKLASIYKILLFFFWLSILALILFLYAWGDIGSSLHQYRF